MTQPAPWTDPIPGGPWDVIVVGAGAAGLMTCLELPQGLRILLLNRNTSRRSSSRWAQGGIASVLPEGFRDDGDSVELHVADTLDAGAGLCHEDVVRTIIREGASTIDDLTQLYNSRHFYARLK